jgi:hypothetical protein
MATLAGSLLGGCHEFEGDGLEGTVARSGARDGGTAPDRPVDASDDGLPAPSPAAIPPPPPPPEPPPPAVGRCPPAGPLPASYRQVASGPRSPDFTFDRDGHFIGFDGVAVVKMLRDSALEVLASDAIGTQGGALRGLPSGDILVADFERGALLVRPPAGPLRRLPSPVPSPMKMARGPDGAVYVTSKQGLITRVAEADGATRPVASLPFPLGGVTFSLDYRVLYVGALGLAAVYGFELRPGGTLGQGRLLTSQVPEPQALTTDECGNLYAAGTSEPKIRRIAADGSVAVVADITGAVPWSLGFGSGRNGWDETSLFVHDGTLYEVPLGVAGQPPPEN